MRRRGFLLGIGSVAALPMPAIAQSSRSRTLKFVPQTNLASLDPVYFAAISTVTHGFYVFDTLYGIDSQYRPHPQMAEGHSLSDDGLTWQIVLRPGLQFHDNTPVLARDCVASITRWSKRDTYGAKLASYADVFEAADDRTIRIRLKQRFPVLLDALAHPHASPCIIMPERLANTDPMHQVTEMVGSGPYRFLPDQYMSASHVGYARFDGYVPRQEAPDVTSGAKIAHFERVEWQIIPDASTAQAALQTGEVDWVEMIGPDSAPTLIQDKRITVASIDPLGFTNYLRFNTLNPPFDKPELRRIILSAVDQRDYNQAIMGELPDYWRTCFALFQCGLPGVAEVGAKAMAGPKDFGKLREAVKAAGYNGEKVVVLNASDTPSLAPLGAITADMLGKLGMAVDLVTADWSTIMARRSSKQPTEKGGWNIVQGLVVASTLVDPMVNVTVRGQGQTGWPGWYESPQVEGLVTKWIAGDTAEQRQVILNQIQEVVFQDVPTVPLGNYFPSTAMRSDIKGRLAGPLAIPWNLQRV
jgi:peptide/nickel transport system substrate-binding protein